MPTGSGQQSTSSLAAFITRKASSQTYLTIHFLADRLLADDAYRAYAYFRWVDDTLDDPQINESDRLAFLTRQQELVTSCYQGSVPDSLCPEEELAADLIQNDLAENSGLRIYIHEMMRVMAFDAHRKGRLITLGELTEYTHCLATAVTEALHYFIGHNDYSPQDESRYAAVTGAHITHMLRDALEDTAVGYINVPQDYLQTHGINPADINHEAYRTWVRSQVQLARHYFDIGRTYIAQVENLRCRLAGYAYIARFEVVLDAIEKDDYILRSAYPERKSKQAMFKIGWAALSQTARSAWSRKRNEMNTQTPAVEVIQ